MSGGKRWATRRDANEAEIVHALRAQAVSVTRIESTRDPGVYDLLCEVFDGEIEGAADTLESLILGARGMTDGELERLRACKRVLDMRAWRWVLLEVKDMTAATPGGKQCIKASELAPGGRYEAVLVHCRPEVARKLRRDQADFLLRHNAPRRIVTTIAEAFRACGLDPCTVCDGTGRAPHLYEKGADAPCPRCEDCSGLEPPSEPESAKSE